VIIGVPAETKPDEHRVALSPAGARELVIEGHSVCVQRGAGRWAGHDDDDYTRQGASLASTAAEVFDAAELIVKVKEPQPDEVELLGEHHTLFTYLHLAAIPELAERLRACGATCFAYETLAGPDGQLPLLAPMSAVAGRLAAQVAATSLTLPAGGRGLLIGGVPGTEPATVLVLGGGVVGTNSARVALGLGADVIVVDRSLERLRELDELFAGRVRTAYSTRVAVEELLRIADVVIGAVLVPGALAPKLITASDLSSMKPGGVLIDVAIDQGGCFETSRATTHAHPTYRIGDVNHYCVANMPGAVPVTATNALTNATLPYIVRLARIGPAAVVQSDPAFRASLNLARGSVTHPAVADALGRDWIPAEQALAARARIV
jgi:alanine dehydrogenase